MAKMEFDQQTWINTLMAMKDVPDLSVAANGEVQCFSQTLWVIHWAGRDCSTQITSLLEVLQYLADSFQLFLVSNEVCKASGNSQCAQGTQWIAACLSFLFLSSAQVDLLQLESNGFHLSVFRVDALSCLTSWLTFHSVLFCSAAAHNSLL